MRSEDVDVERQRRRCQARRNLAVKEGANKNGGDGFLEESLSLYNALLVLFYVFFIYVCFCGCFSFFSEGKQRLLFFFDKVGKLGTVHWNDVLPLFLLKKVYL